MLPAEVEGNLGSSARRWVVLYDASCGFCIWALAWLLRWDRRARLWPYALDRPEAATMLAELVPTKRMESWHLISPDGERRSGGGALPALLRLLPGGAIPAGFLDRLPRLTNGAYRWVAAHRSSFSRMIPSGSKRRASALVQRYEAEPTLGCGEGRER